MDKKYWILAIVAVCVICGCVAWFGLYDNSKKALSDDVAAFSRSCPMELSPGNVIESLTYDKDADRVTANVAVTNALAAADSVAHADKLTLFFQSAENRRLLKDMAKAGAGMTINYVSGESGASIYQDIAVEYAGAVDARIDFTPAQMSEMEQKALLSGKERSMISLRDRVLMLSGMCPLKWGDDATLSNIAVAPDAKQVVMYMQAGKFGSPEYQTKLFKSELKANQRESGLVREMVKELASVGYGIKVCYLSEDGATIGDEIDIPARDIYNISQVR